MTLTGKQRRDLFARSHPLKPVTTLADDELTPQGVQHVRDALARHELVKVRLTAASGRECDLAAAELARQLGGEVVKRTGRVVLLYRCPADNDHGGA